MSIDRAIPSPKARVIVVGNEKGGSGKSTVAMHVAIALMKSNKRVATIDLDSRQRTLTNYIENRFDRAQHITRNLEIPHHLYFVENTNYPTADDEAADGKALTDHVVALARNYSFIVIDTPGRNSYLGRLAHSIADILITPLNDSFVDLDVLGTVDRLTMGVTGTSHYAQMVQDARLLRYRRDDVSTDWFVLRNRLSMRFTQHTLCGRGAARAVTEAQFSLHCRPKRARDLS